MLKITKLTTFLFCITIIIYNLEFLIKPTTNSIITTYKKINNIIPKKEIEKENKDEIIGKIIIKKIGINSNLYSLKSPKNNVEENITILEGSIEPSKENSIVFIAAHSGSGKIAYFKNLDQLKEQDEIILIYENKTYIYEVKNYWETLKNGYINVSKETKKQLILTTCSPTKEDYQLIINCIEKEPS